MNKTLKFFYEISKIPRESGNEENIAKYLCEFAKKRNLYYRKDEYNNVIIKKQTSNNSPIILQAHMDMVCEKDEESKINFKKDGIEIIEEDGYLLAKGTTLGADNGIGVSQILNILDSDIKTNIEAIFTVSEETTMIGAEKIDLSDINAKQMINLDGFEEETIIIESAGFFDIVLNNNYITKNKIIEKIYKIKLKGLEGGHSGFDINKNKGNSNILLAQLLKNIKDLEIINFIGGTKFNVIPSSAECIFSCNEDIVSLRRIVDIFLNSYITEYSNLEILLEEVNLKEDVRLNNKLNSKEVDEDKSIYQNKDSKEIEVEILDKEDSKEFINSILSFKNGVFCKNEREEITTSMNLGIIDFKSMKIGMRSSRINEQESCLEYLKQYANDNNLEFIILGSQPGFETKEDSQLVKKLKKSYEKIEVDKKANIKAVHITVEAGFFKQKIKDLEVAIISPKILNAHTTKECVDIDSVKKCDKWLLEVLKNGNI